MPQTSRVGSAAPAPPRTRRRPPLPVLDAPVPPAERAVDPALASLARDVADVQARLRRLRVRAAHEQRLRRAWWWPGG
jgi:hypothetical protein